MKKFPWFKVWNDDSYELGLVTLWDQRNLEAVAFYYKLCQLMSKFENHDARGKLTISWATICRETRTKLPKALRLYADCTAVALVRTESATDTQLELAIPNWLKTQEIRERKTIDKPVINRSRREKREERRENKEERRQKEESISLLALEALPQEFSGKLLTAAKEQVSSANQERINQLLIEYEPATLAEAINECATYYENQPKRFKAATNQINNWLKTEWNLKKYPKKKIARQRVDSMDHDDGYIDPILGRR